jgi:hypothetical protein
MPEEYNLNVMTIVNIPAPHEGEDASFEYGPDFV